MNLTREQHEAESQRLFTLARAFRKAGNIVWAHAKFYVAEGNMPRGIHLDKWSGAITGTPKETGFFTLGSRPVESELPEEAMNASTKLLLERARKRQRSIPIEFWDGWSFGARCGAMLGLAIIIAIGIYAHATRQPSTVPSRAFSTCGVRLRCDREPRENAR